MENFENREGKESSKYPYDAVVMLGGGLVKKQEKYYPTDYRHGDQFGMLGAGMRIVAALELYLNKQARNFVFSTGVTEKNKSQFGLDVPTEASIYRDKFLRVLGGLQKRSDYEKRFHGLEDPRGCLRR